jgi:hypothetical protein
MDCFILRGASGAPLPITRDNLAAQLLQQWPAADIDLRPARPALLSWELALRYPIRLPHILHAVAGTLRDDATISVLGDEEACIDTLLWLRSVIPPSFPLEIQQDHPDHLSYLLTPATTKPDLVRLRVSPVDGMQAAILGILLAHRGRCETDRLRAALMQQEGVSRETREGDLSQALEAMWQLGLIASPGRRWLPTALPPSADTLSQGGPPDTLTMTSSGLLALKQYRHRLSQDS